MNITIRTYDEVRSNRVSIEVAAGEKAEISVDGETSARLYTEDEVIAAQASEGELIGKALTADLERQRKITRDLEGHYQRKLAEAFSLADRYAEELDKLRAELTQVENSAGVTDAEAREAHRLLKEADGRADRLIARANELEMDLAAITQQRDAFKAQAYEQNDRAAELRQQIKELGDKHQRELDAVRTAHNATRNRLDTVGQHRRAAENKLATAEDQVAALRRILQQARELLEAPEVEQARRVTLSESANRMSHAIGATLRVLDRA